MLRTYRLHDEQFPSHWADRGNSLLGSLWKAEYNANEMHSNVALHFSFVMQRVNTNREESGSCRIHYLFGGSLLICNLLVRKLTALGMRVVPKETTLLDPPLRHLGWCDQRILRTLRIRYLAPDQEALRRECERVSELHSGWLQTNAVLRGMIRSVGELQYRVREPRFVFLERLAALTWGGTAAREGDEVVVRWPDGPHTRILAPPPPPFLVDKESGYLLQYT